MSKTRRTHPPVLARIALLLTRRFSSPREFLRQILIEANSAIGADAGFIGLTRFEGDRPVIAVGDKYREMVGAARGRWDVALRSLPIGGADLPSQDRTFSGYVAHTKRSRRSGDVSREEFYRKDRASTQSELAVPIILDGEVLGVINLQSRKRHFYSESHTALLESVARIIAPTLDRLLVRDRSGFQIAGHLKQLGVELSAISQGVPLGRNSLDAAAASIAATLSSRKCRVYQVDGSEVVRLTLLGQYGTESDRRFRSRLLADKALPQLLNGRTVHDWASSTRPRGRSRGARHVSTLAAPFLIAPILSGGRTVGLIAVGGRSVAREGSSYTPADVQTIQIIQGRLAAALEAHALRVARRRQALDQARTLSEWSKIFENLDLHSTLNLAVEKIPRLCGARGCSIFLWDGRTFVLKATSGLDPQLVGSASYESGEGLTGWVGKHGTPLRLRNRTRAELARIDKDLRWSAKFETARTRSELLYAPFMAVPVFLEGRSAGVIWISDRVKPGPFTEADLDILTAVATHVAATISHRERTDDRMRLLGTVQHLLQSLHGRFSVIRRGDEETPAQSFVTEVLDEVRRGLAADVVTLYFFDSSTMTFRTPPVCAGELKHPELMNHPLQLHDAPWLIVKKGSHFWRDARSAKAIAQDSIDVVSAGPNKKRFPIREQVASTAGVPLMLGKECLGVLFANYRRPQAFRCVQKEMVDTLAGHLALSIGLARLYRQVRRLASDEEREFLGQDLHDAVCGPALTAENMCSAASLELSRGQAADALRHLSIVSGATRTVRTELRDIVTMLKTSTLEESGIVSALRLLNEQIWKPQGLIVNLPSDRVYLPRMVQRHLYRLVQTAIQNSVQGAARRVDVTFAADDRSLVVTVADDGTGFDLSSALATPYHFGLKGIQARARLLGGEAQVKSAPGAGTSIVATIPANWCAHGSSGRL